ncbi:charged multivesicular body protein 1b-like [Papaver somniferum]|uniref:charged multivesicular body protein 1b-like n=1 Tax=Papaver somniferum TaxID=3469 RepID=UPI000E70106A|nr:charged multivesicular body protein 1b-like [Papaver somniferum]
MAQGLEKSKNKSEELKSLSENLKTVAKEREKEVAPEKLRIKDAIEKQNGKEMRIHARNMVRMRQEVANDHQISRRIDSMVDYFDKEPEQSAVFSFIPTIVEAIDSSLAPGNSKKLATTVDEIEKRYFSAEVVSKFKYSSITENRPVFMSEEEKLCNLIQKVADEYKLKVSVRLEHSPGMSPTVRDEVKWFDDSQVKTKSTSWFNIFACYM